MGNLNVVFPYKSTWKTEVKSLICSSNWPIPLVPLALSRWHHWLTMSQGEIAGRGAPGWGVTDFNQMDPNGDLDYDASVRVAPPNWPYFISYFNTCKVAVDVEKDSVKSCHCQTFQKRSYRLADLFPYTHLGETKPKMAHQDFRSSDSILAYPCSTEMIRYDFATFGRGSRCFLMGFWWGFMVWPHVIEMELQYPH